MDILHIDMNSFYVSVELIERPELKGKAVAVGGDEKLRHGIILAKTPLAKSFGVKTGEAIWQAKVKCPDLIIIPPNYDKYLKISNLAQKIYYSYTNQVEPYGMDECFLDISGSLKLFGPPEKIAYEIKERIKSELKVTVSVGLSFNKVFAKLASDMRKPDFVTVIKKENFKNIVWPLKVEDLIMIGPATANKLNKINIKTLGELANADPLLLKRLLGINGVKLWNWANGRDYSRVKDYYEAIPIKSIGRSITLREDLINFEEVRSVIQKLCQDISKRLIENKYLARGINVGYKGNDFSHNGFDILLSYPTNSSLEISAAAIKVLREKFIFSDTNHIRALYVRAIKLISNEELVQLSIFKDIKKHYKYLSLEKTIYNIRKKYGKDAISYANLMGDLKMPNDGREEVIMPASFWV